jgi:DNA-binding MarR family transcriptional regulator
MTILKIQKIKFQEQIVIRNENMAKANREDIFQDEAYKGWWLLQQARNVVFLLRSRELSQYGITAEQASILLTIKMLNEQNTKITPGEISKRILREPHSVSKILSRMEKEGFVSKLTGMGKKKNEVHITLTEKGEQVYNYAIRRESIREVMSIFSEDECRELVALLTRLRDKSLKDLSKSSHMFLP